MMENKEINMKKEHYEKLDEIDLKMERLCVLERLVGKRIFGIYMEDSNEENEETTMLLNQLEEDLKEIKVSISSILNDAQVI